MFSKGRILTYALGIFFLMGSVGIAQADNWDHKCYERINHEQRELDKAVARHGFYSRQAEHERHELNRLEAGCRCRYGC